MQIFEKGSEKACQKISDRDGQDDYFIIAHMPQYTLGDISKQIGKNDNVLGIIMDGLEQPGNIGAILRSCDGAGSTFAIIVNKQTTITNSRLIRSSFGSVFMIPTLEADIKDANLKEIKAHVKIDFGKDLSVFHCEFSCIYWNSRY